MKKSTRPRVSLPADLHPTEESRHIVARQLDRCKDEGITQSVIADRVGIQSRHFLSMLKTTNGLGLERVLPFAKATGMSHVQAIDLLDARLMELHGQQGQMCVEALTAWGIAMFAPRGDVRALEAAWEEAIAPAPEHLHGLLAKPEAMARVRQLLKSIAQDELRSMHEGASA